MRFALFFLVFGGLTALLHWYLYRRLVKDTSADARAHRFGKLAIVVLWLALVAGGPLNWLFRSSITDAIATVSWIWVGVATYLWLTLGALGLAALALRKTVLPAPVSAERRLFLSRAVAGTAAVATAGVTGYGVWRVYTAPEVNELSVLLPKLPRALDGFSLVQVSDIHVGPLVRRQFMDDMVARVNALKPDLVAVTGDLVDGDVPTLGHAVAALQNLRSRAGTYFITGNHEYYSGDREWSAALEGLGVTVLRNRRVSIGDAGASFDLIGVDDWMGDEGRRYDLGKAIAGRDPERASVLLAHQPANFQKAAALGVGLQLSGHTHGGQLFPFNLLLPIQWEFTAGHYQRDGAHLYVNRGTGFWGPPMRVGAPPEITRIVLRAG